MAKNADPSEIVSLLTKTQTPVYILSHPSPDGDSIGSSVGLYHLLMAKGVEGVLVIPQPIPEKYIFLLKDLPTLPPPVDLTGAMAVVLDCSDFKRLNELGQSLNGAEVVINIDHHLHNDMFGDYNLVDTQAAAAGQIVYRLFQEQRPFPKPAAQALFTAIFTDTGRFSYSNTSAEVLRETAGLIQLGASPNQAFEAIYQNRSPQYYSFLAQALSKIELWFSGRAAVVCLEQKLLEQSNIPDWELDDFIDYPRGLKNVEFAAVLKETSQGVRLSMRSRGRINVATIARKLGGGGHRNAAGATVYHSLAGSLEELKILVEQEFEN